MRRRLNGRSNSVLRRRCVLSRKSKESNGVPRRTRGPTSLLFGWHSQAVGSENSRLRRYAKLKKRGERPWKSSATNSPAAALQLQLNTALFFYSDLPLPTV